MLVAAKFWRAQKLLMLAADLLMLVAAKSWRSQGLQMLAGGIINVGCGKSLRQMVGVLSGLLQMLALDARGWAVKIPFAAERVAKY